MQNTALYSTFAVVGFSAGTFVNRLGVRPTLSFGGIGYCIYSISLLVSLHKDIDGFNIFAGALLGVCGGLLWTAQGTIMLSYPLEEDKGRYFSWFWAIFNIGGCIGSLVCFFGLSGPFSTLKSFIDPTRPEHPLEGKRNSHGRNVHRFHCPYVRRGDIGSIYQ